MLNTTSITILCAVTLVPIAFGIVFALFARPIASVTRTLKWSSPFLLFTLPLGRRRGLERSPQLVCDEQISVTMIRVLGVSLVVFGLLAPIVIYTLG